MHKIKLGLIPYEDYIVGVKCKSSPIIPLNNDDFSPLEILSEVIRKNKGNFVKFYIYNKEKGARDVTAKIGDDYYFNLGCDAAFGALHMFPSLEMGNNIINNDKNSDIKIENEEKRDNQDNKTDNENKELEEMNKKENIKSNENIDNVKIDNLDEKNNIYLISDNKEKEELNLISKKEVLQYQENNEETKKEIQNIANNDEVNEDNNKEKIRS